MNPCRILVAMSTTRWSRRLHDVALREVEKARTEGREAELEVLYVVEQAEIDFLVKRVGDGGFLGLETQAALMKTLLDEHERVAVRRQERVRRAVEDVGCPTTWHKVTGDYEKEVHGAVTAGGYDTVVLVRSDTSFLQRLFYGSEDDRVARWVRDETGARVLIEDGVRQAEPR